MNFFLNSNLCIIIILLMTIISCKQKSLSTKNCELELLRFEEDFFNIDSESFDSLFPAIKDKYPTFFLDNNVDYKKDILLNDTLRDIFDSVQSVFKGELFNQAQIKSGLCKYNSYYPNETLSFVTYIEGSFDYRYPVVYSDDKLYISLDLFLGSDHSFYYALPKYIKISHDKRYIPSISFLALAGKHIPISETNSFISTILYYAKAYYFTKSMLDGVEDHVLFKCSIEKMNWCEKNESTIWEYMIENDYLFSSDPELNERFVYLSPFSKFGLSIDQYSPGGVGVWIGLKIIESYVEHNNVSFYDLLIEQDYNKILNKSGYRP